MRLLIALLLALPAVAQPPSDLYYLAFLRPSPDRKALPKEEGEKIQADHMANILGMAQRGVLVAAGPFGDTATTISGIFVFKVGSLDEARKIASADPTVTAGRNTVEIHPWRGPKGIGEEYFRLHKADPKTPEDMGVQPFFLFLKGPNWSRMGEFLPAHLEHLKKLGAAGKIAAAGRIEDDSDLGGILVFQRMPDADARRLVEDDPFVTNGVVKLEAHRWWCAAHVLPGW
jgi:uncharacterized protein YciI